LETAKATEYKFCAHAWSGSRNPFLNSTLL